MKKLKHLLLVLVCVTLAAFAMTGCEKTSSQKEDEAQSEIEAQNIKDVTSFTKNFANLMTKYTYEDFETAQAMTAQNARINANSTNPCPFSLFIFLNQCNIMVSPATFLK